MVKHTQIIRQLLLTNCLSVIYHFLWLALVVGADFGCDFTFSVWFVYGIQWTEAMVCRYYAKQVLLKISQSSLKNSCLGAFFSNQVADWRPATLFKRRLRHIGFPVNFAKLIRTPFLLDTRGVRFWVDTQPKLNVFKTITSNWSPGSLILIQNPFRSCAPRASISSPKTDDLEDAWLHLRFIWVQIYSCS